MMGEMMRMTIAVVKTQQSIGIQMIKTLIMMVMDAEMRMKIQMMTMTEHLMEKKTLITMD